ncbi:MAG: ferrochelatase [Proteobacteria bacterium]|nr:ferrochelatase [Pseudomonadota bacterium]
MTKHIAVVLFNLGGPDKKESIKPFLFNFFMDPNIIRAPKIVRYGVATLISILRTRKQAGESYAKLGNKSPLLENTRAQATALSTRLNVDANVKFSVHVCMRYWHPMAEEVAQRVKNDNPDQIILLPLYPQFSTTTTWSSFGEWQKACAKVDMDKPTGFVCCYPTQAGFIAASADLIRTQYDAMREECEAQGMKAPRVLFSAHGLPEDIIADGDPYQWQCEKTAELIAAQLGIPQLDWQICYQSRVGPKKWIGPSTEVALEKAAHDKVPVLIYPHAFVSEHVETLVEIEDEYREMAEHMGVPGFARVPTVSVHKAFIEGLADMVRSRVDVVGLGPDVMGRICPSGFTRCCMGQGIELVGARPCLEKAPQVTIGI